jgi:hypothetical protein
MPRHSLPGRSFGSNECVWMCNAHLADSKAFLRAILAKVCQLLTERKRRSALINLRLSVSIIFHALSWLTSLINNLYWLVMTCM